MADDNEGEGPVSDTQLLEEISTRKREVDLLLSKKNKAKALEVSLQNPPVATKTAEVKVDYSLQRHKTFCKMTITANFCLSLSLSLRMPIQKSLKKFLRQSVTVNWLAWWVIWILNYVRS
jgi:hypothetical protein